MITAIIVTAVFQTKFDMRCQRHIVEIMEILQFYLLKQPALMIDLPKAPPQLYIALKSKCKPQLFIPEPI